MVGHGFSCADPAPASLQDWIQARLGQAAGRGATGHSRFRAEAEAETLVSC